MNGRSGPEEEDAEGSHGNDLGDGPSVFATGLVVVARVEVSIFEVDVNLLVALDVGLDGFVVTFLR